METTFMESSEDSYSNSINCHIGDLPDEILDFIISLLRPYEDLKTCMLVCKRWNKSALRVIHHTKSNFNRCLANFDINWEHYTPPERGQSISKRYSHSACIYGNSMYVFGGCTCTSTTFNDLWELDLSSRKWSRIITMGTYPTPKALATIVYYEGMLVLFGGWTHPTPFPLHQAWRTFNELHVYDIANKRWSCVVTPTLSPPPMAGHSATVHKDEMIVFGGICGQMVTGSANDIWCFNFHSQCWRKQETTSEKPVPRYNQSQIALDDDHLLIIGGCGSRPSILLNDVWMLKMVGNVWQWIKITVHSPQWSMCHPSNGQLWCHPACKSGTNVIAIGRSQKSIEPLDGKLSPVFYRPRLPNENLLGRDRLRNESPPVDRDVNVNGRRGVLTPRFGQVIVEESPANNQEQEGTKEGDQSNCNANRPRSSDSRPSSLERNRHPPPYSINRNINLPTNNNMAAFRGVPANTGNKFRERQLEILHRMEEKFKNLSRNPQQKPTKGKESPAQPVGKLSTLKMAMFVMDISSVLLDHSVTWLPIKSVAADGPEHTILYSLVAGQGEIIMFGGIQKDINHCNIEMSSMNVINTVTNTLHFMTAPQTVI